MGIINMNELIKIGISWLEANQDSDFWDCKCGDNCVIILRYNDEYVIYSTNDYCEMRMPK